MGSLEAHTRNHFQDLDRLKISRITAARLERFMTERQKRGMNIGTLRKILVTLNQIMNYAVRHKYVDHNPLAEAERPRGRGAEEDDRDKIKILTPLQIQAFLEAETAHEYHALFMLAIFTGLRQGELLGLKWSDIDWDSKQVHVQRTYNKGRFFNPKTKGSNRKVDLGPKVMIELKKWKLACPANELNLIFQNEYGNAINYSNMINRHFKVALRTAGLPRIRFHDLRHSYTSLLIEQGENIKYIQAQLRHSSPTVTWNVYAHLMKPSNQEAVKKLENTVFGASGSKTVEETEKGITDVP